MAHFCELDKNQIVLRVIVIPDNVLKNENGIEIEENGIKYCKSLYGENTNWVQTSYNKNFREKYAGIGFKYLPAFNCFIEPQPFPSWTLNESTLNWEAPIPKPELTKEQIDNLSYYIWDEKNKKWSLNIN